MTSELTYPGPSLGAQLRPLEDTLSAFTVIHREMLRRKTLRPDTERLREGWGGSTPKRIDPG